MTREERALTLSTISWCDQIEAHILNGDGDALEQAQEFIRQWAEDLGPAEVIVYLRQVKAQAEQLLREEEDAQREE